MGRDGKDGAGLLGLILMPGQKGADTQIGKCPHPLDRGQGPKKENDHL